MKDKVCCKDCRWSFRKLSSLPIWGSGVEWRCRMMFVESKTEFDPVNGPITTPAHYERCMSARSFTNEQCGPDAKLWEPTSKKLFLQYLKRI